MATAPTATVNPPEALDRLRATLRDYKRISGRSALEVLGRKGGQVIFGNQDSRFGAQFDGLIRLFQAQAPRPGAITAEAEARGYRFGRKGSAATGVNRGFSPTTIKRALARMGGFKSILVESNPHTGRVTFVRRGLRKARVHLDRRRRSFAVPGNYIGPLRRGNQRRVNFRAVATLLEMTTREHGRNFLGSSYIFRRWQKFALEGFVPVGTPGLKPGFGKSRQFGGSERRLVNNNPRSFVTPLGEASFAGSESSDTLSLTISSNVPGVGAVGTGRQLFTRAINAVTADMDRYIARKQVEALTADLASL